MEHYHLSQFLKQHFRRKITFSPLPFSSPVSGFRELWDRLPVAMVAGNGKRFLPFGESAFNKSIDLTKESRLQTSHFLLLFIGRLDQILCVQIFRESRIRPDREISVSLCIPFQNSCFTTLPPLPPGADVSEYLWKHVSRNRSSTDCWEGVKFKIYKNKNVVRPKLKIIK